MLRTRIGDSSAAGNSGASADKFFVRVFSPQIRTAQVAFYWLINTIYAHMARRFHETVQCTRRIKKSSFIEILI